MKKTDPPIIVEEIYPTTIDHVWKAITEPDQMRKWFFEQIETFKAEEGFETSFVVALKDKTFTHLWKIVEVKPNEKINYQWRYEEHPGNSIVTFELTEKAEGVHIKFHAEVTEDFPSGIPEFKRESAVGGWNYFIKKSLKEYLSR